MRDVEALRRDLRRWVAADLITADQAAAIEASESAESVDGAAPKAPSRVPIVVEALGYVGGALAVVAGFIATADLWRDMSRGMLEGFAAAGCLVLLAGGAALRSADDPAFGRLRSVLWLLSAACLAAFAALLGDDHSSDDAGLVMVVGLITAAYLLGLHLWDRSLLLVIALFVALAIAAGALSQVITDNHGAWPIGLAVWLLGVVWAAGAGRVAALEPVDGALLGGVGGAFVGAQLMMTRDLGHLVAVLTVAAVIVAGTLLRRTWMLALGTLGVLVVVPQTATRFLPDSVGAPVAVFVVGAGLVAIAVWLARRPGRRHPAG